MLKPMIRAARRRHAERIKEKRRFYFGRDLKDFPRALGRVLNTAAQVKQVKFWNELPWRQKKLLNQAELAG